MLPQVRDAVVSSVPTDDGGHRVVAHVVLDATARRSASCAAASPVGSRRTPSRERSSASTTCRSDQRQGGPDLAAGERGRRAAARDRVRRAAQRARTRGRRAVRGGARGRTGRRARRLLRARRRLALRRRAPRRPVRRPRPRPRRQRAARRRHRRGGGRFASPTATTPRATHASSPSTTPPVHACTACRVRPTRPCSTGRSVGGSPTPRVYSFAYRGIDHRAVPDQTVAAIARRNVTAMRAVDPRVRTGSSATRSAASSRSAMAQQLAARGRRGGAARAARAVDGSRRSVTLRAGEPSRPADPLEQGRVRPSRTQRRTLGCATSRIAHAGRTATRAHDAPPRQCGPRRPHRARPARRVLRPPPAHAPLAPSPPVPRSASS